MGNSSSSNSAADRLALVSLSRVVQTKRSDILTLRYHLLPSSKSKSQTRPPQPTQPQCTRTQFTRHLISLQIPSSDIDIFDRCFTLYDKTGANRVDAIEFLIGISALCSSSNGSGSGSGVEKRLILACEVKDIAGSGLLYKSEVVVVLKSLMLLCGFLGDPVMGLDEIDELCESVFTSLLQDDDDNNYDDSGSKTEVKFDYKNNVKEISEHPLFEMWLGGKEEEFGGARAAA